MRLPIITLALVATSPAFADYTINYPISIPSECIAVAQREHVPTVMNSKFEATKAALKLDKLSDRDPIVFQCKQSVARLKAMM
jgi:hypothetical protein